MTSENGTFTLTIYTKKLSCEEIIERLDWRPVSQIRMGDRRRSGAAPAKFNVCGFEFSSSVLSFTEETGSAFLNRLRSLRRELEAPSQVAEILISVRRSSFASGDSLHIEADVLTWIGESGVAIEILG